MIIINNESNKQTGVTNEETNQNANHYLLDSTSRHSGYSVLLSGWQRGRAMTEQWHLEKMGCKNENGEEMWIYHEAGSVPCYIYELAKARQLREDLVHFIASLYDGLPAPALTHDYLRDIVKPTAEEVEEYFDSEGGNTERAFEMFGVQPDDLKYARGE